MSAPEPITIDDLLGHRAWVRRIARRLVRDEAEADDVEQEVWLRALRSGPRCARAIRAWLRTVLLSVTRDRWRSESARARREAGSARPDRSDPATADVVAEGRALRAVVDAVMGLPEPWRETVLLRYWRDLPPGEIARRTATPTETVRTRLKRARARLREELDRGHGGDRSAWLASLALLAGRGPGPGVATIGSVGGILMVKKLALAVVVLLVSGAAWLGLESFRGEAGRPPAPPGGAPLELAAPESPAQTSPAEPAEESVVLTVLVRDVAGRPVAGATAGLTPASVAADPDRIWTAARGDAPATGPATGADGSVSLPVPPTGIARITVRARGFATTTRRISDPGRRAGRTLEIVLLPARTLSGLVTGGRGRPCAGAVVLLDPGWGLPPVRGVTDAAGTYHIGGLGDREYTVRVSPAPGVILEAGTVLVPDVTRFDVRIDGGAALRAEVLEFGSGAPVPGATVDLSVEPWRAPGSRTTRVRVVTGPDGSIRVDDLPPGRVREIAIGKPGYLPGPPPRAGDGGAILLAEGATAEATWRLRRGAVVRGVVTRSDGAPVAGAKVALAGLRFSPDGRRWAGPRSVRTAGDGSYRFDGVERGGGMIRAWAPGLEVAGMPHARWEEIHPDEIPAPLRVAVRGSGEIEKNLVLEPVPTGTVEGRVTGPDGAAVGDATVSAGAFGGYSRTRSAADGSFVLHPGAGTGLVVAAGRPEIGYGSSAPLDLAAGGSVRGVDIALARGPGQSRASGRVLAPDGGPAPDATVFLGAAGFDTRRPSDMLERLPGGSFPVGADGRFDIPNLGGTPRRIVATAPGARPAVSDLLPAGKSVSGLVLELPPARRVRGVVLSEAGTPVPGAAIRLLFTGYRDDTIRACSDRDGRFALELPLDGPAVALARAPGFAPGSEPVPEGDVEMTVRLAPGLAVSGRAVVEGTGAPAAFVPVRAVSASDPDRAFDTLTAADGRFAIPDLPAGAYRLVLGKWFGSGPPPRAIGGFQPTSLPAVRAGSEPLVVQLSRGGVIAGRVVDPGGRAISGRLRISLLRHPPDGAFPVEGFLDRETAADGTFRLTGLTPGRYEMWTNPPAGTTLLTARSSDVATGTEDLVVTLGSGRAIRGIVVNGNGEPVAAPGRIDVVWVEGFGLPQDGRQPSDGRFETRPLDPEGRYDVIAHGFGDGRVGLARGVRPGAAELRLRLAPGAKISGRLVSPAGAPADEGLPVVVSPIADDGRRIPIEFRAATGAGGRFTVDGLPDGYPYHLEAGGGKSGWLHATREGAVEAGATDVTLVLVRAAEIRGKLLDASGAPAHGWAVTARTAGGRYADSAPVGLDGSFVLSRVTAGDVTLSAERASTRIELGRFSAPARDLALRLPR